MRQSVNLAKMVTLPPGRERLATRPVPSGSFASANTIGRPRRNSGTPCSASQREK